MINLRSTDLLEVITDAAITLDVVVSWADLPDTLPASPAVPVATNTTVTAITTATTTTIVASPAANTTRNVKTIQYCNKGATLAGNVETRFNRSATGYRLNKTLLLAGEEISSVEGVNWFRPDSNRFDRWLRMAADYVNATTSFTDITGLTVEVESGKTYNFEAHLINVNNATTTGSRFGINGPTLSAIRVGVFGSDGSAVAGSGTHSGSATAVDTAASATTTGGTGDKTDIVSGVFTTGAAGTFALRGASEIAVAAGLTVRAGSWLHVWEPTG